MKLISMHVDNFGVLHNYDFNFEEGLNVVLHDNGWGKTTMASFLKAMLYGLDTKRSRRDITENERKRYLPWQGGKYGGYLDFEAEDVRYRIYRTFGETPRYDTVKIVNLDTKATARIPADKIGETLFHLDASAFQRSVFINQNGLSIDGASSSIHTRLNNLVSQANDVAAFDEAISSLTQETKVYEKRGDRGQLGDIGRQIDQLEQARRGQERIIAQQDAARERISELDTLLSAINKDIEEKSRKLDEVSGEGKKRETVRKLLADIDSQITALQEQIDAIKTDLGGGIPSREEIDLTKRQVQTAASLRKQIAELEASLDALSKEYKTLLEEYGGMLPTSSQLDQIQSIYGEKQGLLASGDASLPETEIPEEYTVLKAAAEDDPEYITRLEKVIGLQMAFQTLIRQLDAENRELKSDEEAWREKAKRYHNLKSEVERLQAAAKEQEDYNPSKAEPVILELEELQKRQQAIDVKNESLSADSLTPEQEALLREHAGELPDISEGQGILKKYHNADKKRAEIQGLTARLGGEKSREDSLTASLEQLAAVKALDTAAPEEPGKSSGTALIGAGAVIAVAGLILGIVIMPALFAVAAVGAALAVMGVISNNNYKNKLQAYTAWQNASALNQEAMRKKEDLQAQRTEVQASIAALEAQISELQKELQADEADVSAWFDQWAAAGEERSGAAISRILETAEVVRKLRKKQDDTAALRTFVRDETAAVDAARSKIDLLYPECSGKSISEALSIIRGKLGTYRIADGQLQAALRNEEKFVEESGATRAQLEMEQSPRAEELSGKRDATAHDLQDKLEIANKELSVLELDSDQEHIIQALRKAEEMFNEYKRYADKLKDHAVREAQKAQKIMELQNRLTDALAPLSDRYSGREIPERLALIREEISKAGRLQARITELDAELKRQRGNLAMADQAVSEFRHSYGRFSAREEDVLPGIYEKAGKYAELTAARQQLENQRNSVEKDQQRATEATALEEESLRAEVTRLTERRDNLLIEYTQKGDFIRQADQALEIYPDTVLEIHALYDQKQKAQNKLLTLRRAIYLITKAKENLANRYLSKVEDLFNSYMHIWLNNDAVRGLLDIDFKVTIEENDKVHVAEGYSTGYCDMIDFCMRLALVDTLFENEQPFLILDDPFVNLDADRLEKALELLNVLAANKQIIYFVCHPIRAVETGENASSREEFLKLAEAAKKTIGERRSGTSSHKTIVRKSPKEMYKVSGSPQGVPFRPAKPDYTITNSIFFMNFVPSESGVQKDNSYELFFIDAVGHVLNERQIIEVNDGKLSTERVQFSLNTRDDSGNEFELMVRESGQDDYEVVARFPFRAKLTFTGSFGFDF